MYGISVATELAGWQPQTLCIYERRVLVQPARTDGGNRRYSDYDIEILRRISELADEGMNLEGIRRVMQLEVELEAARREIDEMRQQLRELADHVEQHQRADLVPLRQAITLFGVPPPFLRRR